MAQSTQNHPTESQKSATNKPLLSKTVQDINRSMQVQYQNSKLNPLIQSQNSQENRSIQVQYQMKSHEKLDKSREFFRELKINNLDIFYGSSLDLAKEFKLRGIPTTIFIDKEGYEFARVIGFIVFENKFFLDWLSNYL